MANALRLVQRPSNRSSTISTCITIENGFIPNWAIYPLKLLNLKMSLSNVSVKNGQDQISTRADGFDISAQSRIFGEKSPLPSQCESRRKE